ncbi:MAG: hypothetical protein ACLP8A_01545 [Methylovirgula sp.]
METYSVDIDAGQVVRWLKAEQETGASPFRITARRDREVEELPIQDELKLGDVEREDLSEVTTMATLDVEPFHANEGWRLSIVIEDDIGPRISDQRGVERNEQQIDIGTFYEEFIRPGRGNANVIVEVENSAAEERLRPLLDDIEKNHHGADRSRSR